MMTLSGMRPICMRSGATRVDGYNSKMSWPPGLGSTQDVCWFIYRSLT